MQKKFLYTILIIFSIFLWILYPAFRHELKISNKCALEFENDSGAVILSFFDNSIVEKNIDFSLYALNVPVRHKYIDFVIKQTSVL